MKPGGRTEVSCGIPISLPAVGGSLDRADGSHASCLLHGNAGTEVVVGGSMTPVADSLSALSDWGYFNVNDYGARQFLREAIRTLRRCSLNS